MSLVQSFINQIGREIGRDVYNSIKSNKSVTVNYGSQASTIWEKLHNFKLLSYDKMTMNNLVNLVESVSSLSANNFENLECFIKMDQKIDFCKENLDKKYLDQLERLDNINQENFKKFILRHKIYIAEMHEKIEQKILNYKGPDKVGIRLINPGNILIGLGIILLMFFRQNLIDWKPASFWILLCMLGIFLMWNISSMENLIIELKEQHDKDKKDLKVLEDYFEQVTKLKFD